MTLCGFADSDQYFFDLNHRLHIIQAHPLTRSLRLRNVSLKKSEKWAKDKFDQSNELCNTPILGATAYATWLGFSRHAVFDELRAFYKWHITYACHVKNREILRSI
jgi:hypothetical protein